MYNDVAICISRFVSDHSTNHGIQSQMLYALL